ncbi:MAG: hypothetical protein G01um101418_864 [Parcubacteria group bacterium Gr01-1014_18]|nr:MAG: hypothetical protein Greene041636_824 [Parcubacteria group bacterium Greene0416_36]TSC79865.1 MAG: hypothetical protein G01um101418_864 [Parcubacteria group bacterium Gr01-1014_18]TSC98297.1 MAG: hypothetical protein Greene101420_801 [Parcubacteria group bacterium Greene1014_20]TSD06662.1 MAG: hypothetical protein Greene07142_714 [Parcubacteria group bacterium Greene0714_2]
MLGLFFKRKSKTGHIPQFLQPFLWAYRLEGLDLEKHKRVIILNLLNLGNKKATDWLFSEYSRKEIVEVLGTIRQGELTPKSLNYWFHIFGQSVPAKFKTRF